MRRLIILLLLAGVLPVSALNIFQTNVWQVTLGAQESETDFDGTYIGYNDQSNIVYFSETLSASDVSNIVWKVSRYNRSTGTNVVHLLYTNRFTLLNTTGVVWTVPFTNNLNNAEYTQELAVWSGLYTNKALFRTLAKGKLNVINSIYDDDDGTVTGVIWGEVDPVAATNAVPIARTVTAGAGLRGGGNLSANITLYHTNLSTATSVNNSAGNVIQDISIDTIVTGHVTSITSTDLDDRYYTETEVDALSLTQTLDSAFTAANQFIVSTASNAWQVESGATARTSLGAGGLADNNTWTGTQDFQGAMAGSINMGDNPLTNASRIDIDMAQSSGDNNAILITPEAAAAGENFNGVNIAGDAIDPSGANSTNCGIRIDFDGVDLTNDPELKGIRVWMPESYTGESDHGALDATGNSGRRVAILGNFQDALHVWGETHTTFTNSQGIADGTVQGVFNVDVDDTGATGGEVHAFGVSPVGAGTANIIGLFVSPGAKALAQDVGTSGASDKSWYWDGTTTNDVTTAFGSAATDVAVFSNDNDYVYIGEAAAFSEVEVILATRASASIFQSEPLEVFEYLTNNAQWVSFDPLDGTDGFQGNGIIQWASGDLTDWSAQSVAGSSQYYIRIQRTRNSLATVPTEDTIKVLEPTHYSWDEDGDLTIRDITVSGTVNMGDGQLTNASLVKATRINGGAVEVEAGSGNNSFIHGKTVYLDIIGSSASGITTVWGGTTNSANNGAYIQVSGVGTGGNAALGACTNGTVSFRIGTTQYLRLENDGELKMTNSAVLNGGAGVITNATYHGTFAGADVTNAIAGIHGDWDTDTTDDFLKDGSVTASGAFNLGANDITNSAVVWAKVPVQVHFGAAVTLSAADCDSVLHINDWTNTIDFTLPTAAAGLCATFANSTNAQIIVVDAASGDQIILNDGTALTAANAADSSNAIDDKGTFVALDADRWMIISEQNAWSDGGAD